MSLNQTICKSTPSMSFTKLPVLQHQPPSDNKKFPITPTEKK